MSDRQPENSGLTPGEATPLDHASPTVMDGGEQDHECPWQVLLWSISIFRRGYKLKIHHGEICVADAAVGFPVK
jgi:hypothetical protein